MTSLVNGMHRVSAEELLGQRLCELGLPHAALRSPRTKSQHAGSYTASSCCRSAAAALLLYALDAVCIQLIQHPRRSMLILGSGGEHRPDEEKDAERATVSARQARSARRCWQQVPWHQQGAAAPPARSSSVVARVGSEVRLTLQPRASHVPRKCGFLKDTAMGAYRSVDSRSTGGTHTLDTAEGTVGDGSILVATQQHHDARDGTQQAVA